MDKLVGIIMALTATGLMVVVDTSQQHIELPQTVIETDRRMMSRLETCYQKFKPEALLSNHGPGKWVTQIWQKDRRFGSLFRDSILLSLPTVPVMDFVEPGELKR